MSPMSPNARPLGFLPPPTLRDAGLALAAGAADARDPDFPFFEFVGSGKAAIAAVLHFLRERGVLRDKMSEVLVPRWLGYPVYQTMLEHAFPTTDSKSGAKVLLAYHQYGFPQDMARVKEYADFRKMVLVEDCAHACQSSFKGKRLGTFGEHAVFSYSKFAFCAALGGVASSAPGFAESLRRRKAAASQAMTAAINAFRWLDEANAARARPLLPEAMTRGRKMFFAAYGDSPLASFAAIGLWQAKKDAEIAARRANYRLVLDACRSTGLCEGLETEGVAPFVVPLMVTAEKIPAVVAALAAAGVRTGSYLFDVNRFLVEPDFRPCVPIPCHGGVAASDLDRILGAVRSQL